jgi:hypothetical protein
MANPAYIVDGVLTDGEAWVAIASTTLGSAAASITFTSTDDGQVGDFSQYMDLVAISYWRSTQTGGWEIGHQNLNGDNTYTNYANQLLYGDGSSVTAGTRTGNPGTKSINAFMAYADLASDIFSVTVSHWFDVNSGKYKSSQHQTADDADGSGYVDITTSTWKSQAAITSILLKSENGNLEAATRIDLFGILPRMVTA